MNTQVSAFLGPRLLARGLLPEVAPRALATPGALVFDDASGRIVDLDPRDWAPGAPAQATRGRGRPKLGVTAREVTLLPRHWDWLASQPGGASAALRRLVEAAARADGGARAAQEASYRVAQALAGDLPGYEDAMRALFSSDINGFSRAIADWPGDLRDWLIARITP